ncbi:MAG: hypothetical protein ACI8TP_003693 [Acidimicrobiales bacterium]|jgi:hypothetical protein
MPDAVAVSSASCRGSRLRLGTLGRHPKNDEPCRPPLPGWEISHPPAQATGLPFLAQAEPPDFEPQLPIALMALPESQRTAVWLAHGCRGTHSEIAEVLEPLIGTSRSAIKDSRMNDHHDANIARPHTHLRRHLERPAPCAGYGIGQRVPGERCSERPHTAGVRCRDPDVDAGLT